MTKFEIFSQPARPIGSQLIHQVLVGVHYGRTFKFKAPKLVLIISLSSGLEIMTLFLLDSLLFEESSNKF